MTVRTVSNLPAAMHVETARCLFAIELSKQLGYWIHYATFREDQPPDLEWRRLERSTRFDEGGASTCQPRDGSDGGCDLVPRGRL
jgi:hypothetical protein